MHDCVSQNPVDFFNIVIPMHAIVVFGFNQTEFSGGERLQNYAVGIGFLSGSASQEVVGSIQLTPVTAGNSCLIGYMLVNVMD